MEVQKIFMQAREKQLKLTKKIHAAPVTFSTTPAINSITVRGLAVLGEQIEYAAEIQATVSSATMTMFIRVKHFLCIFFSSASPTKSIHRGIKAGCG